MREEEERRNVSITTSPQETSKDSRRKKCWSRPQKKKASETGRTSIKKQGKRQRINGIIMDKQISSQTPDEPRKNEVK